MTTDFPIVIHHNPACRSSRNTLQMIRDAGHEPKVVEYLKTGWTRPELERLLERMGKRPRDILRVSDTPAEKLGLLTDGVSDEALLDAMAQHPIMVQRPIVETPKGVRLCRPAESVADIL